MKLVRNLFTGGVLLLICCAAVVFSSVRGDSNSAPLERITERSRKFSSSRTLPGQ